MERTASLKISDLAEMTAAIFLAGSPIVFESYSKMEAELLKFDNKDDLDKHIQAQIAQKKPFVNLSIYYPEAEGPYIIRKIKLNPEQCGGKTYRFNAAGWGLIQFQIDFKNTEPGTAECRIAVNTEKRANKWHPNYPDLQSPELWNWKTVASKARKLANKLKKTAAKTAD